MKAEIDNLDEYGKRVLAPLRDVPAMDPVVIAEERKKFLRQGELFRAAMQANPEPQVVMEQAPSRRSFSLMKLLVGALIALVILVGSSATVFASQNSLPGQPLYFVKSISEDVRLALAPSPQARLELTLSYTDRRMGEIKSIINSGKDLPDQASDRFNIELETALNLASEMDDRQMMRALNQISITAKSQGTTLEELINKLPNQADPAVIRLKERLQEQVQLSDMGEEDPQSFREKMQKRQFGKSTPKPRTPTSTLPGGLPGDGTSTPGKPGKGNQSNNGNPDPGGQNNQNNGSTGDGDHTNPTPKP